LPACPTDPESTEFASEGELTAVESGRATLVPLDDTPVAATHIPATYAEADVRLRLNSVAENVMTLGPAPATVIWCQGCSIGCVGCMSPETWSSTGGVLARVLDVAAWLPTTSSQYLTLAGGEPTEQAQGLNALLDCLTAEWIVTMYSGRTLAELKSDRRPGVSELLNRADLAITGPYRRELHAPLRWRGSSNQELVNISGRIELPDVDAPAGVEVRLRRGGIEFLGVPPQPDFDRQVRAASSALGAELQSSSDPASFPFPVTDPSEA